MQDGEHLIQTRRGEDGPDLESSLEVEWTRVGVQVNVKDKGEIFGLHAWMDKEYCRRSRF